MKQTFKKDEKLRSRSIIDRLFKRGSKEVQTFYLFPFRVLYFEGTSEARHSTFDDSILSETSDTYQGVPSPLPQVLFSVSKRNFKRAVDRNLIRRRCREAYRLHKPILLQNPEVPYPTSIAFLYLAKEISTYDVIEKAMIKVLRQMAKPN
ncbi:ribonuclease P protein component [Salmonirosea aquatica]|uniref:Ribonuclease P protein component n=1 Tax=Salmonirosea aquatica TaxID=2654236 RepID=A0A7C9BHL6_9BACT|nr:ribonuclease P protein component [Cytophagaceae bacterium SJW1-29]